MAASDTGNVLVINFDQASAYWYAAVQNNTNIFRFCGETPDQQRSSIQRLGQLMQAGITETIVDELANLLQWPAALPSGAVWTSETMFDVLFADTTALETVTTELFLAPAGSFLVSVLEAAGEFLLTALAV